MLALTLVFPIYFSKCLSFISFIKQFKLKCLFLSNYFKVNQVLIEYQYTKFNNYQFNTGTNQF